MAGIESGADTDWNDYTSAFTDILSSDDRTLYRRKDNFLYLYFRGQFENNVSAGRSFKLFNVKDIGITLSPEADAAFGQ